MSYEVSLRALGFLIGTEPTEETWVFEMAVGNASSPSAGSESCRDCRQCWEPCSCCRSQAPRAARAAAAGVPDTATSSAGALVAERRAEAQRPAAPLCVRVVRWPCPTWGGRRGAIPRRGGLAGAFFKGRGWACGGGRGGLQERQGRVTALPWSLGKLPTRPELGWSQACEPLKLHADPLIAAGDCAGVGSFCQ